MNIGTLLRQRRKQRGMTLRAVSEQAGVSEGFLSQVENSVKSPSITTLMNICSAMGAEAGELLNQLQHTERLFVIRAEEWADVDLPHTGFATRRFCPPESRSVMDSAMLFIEPGRSIPVRKNVKNGQEILCVLQGCLELVHGDKNLTLKSGDAVHLWTEPAHQQVTNNGQELAVVMWVGTL